MGMEHRWNTRTPVNVTVTLNYPLASPIRGRIRDISLGGLLVSTPGNLDRNSIVEVVLSLPEGALTRIIRLQAMVVWATANRAGLMFCHFDRAIFRVLQALTGDHRASRQVKALLPSRPTEAEAQ